MLHFFRSGRELLHTATIDNIHLFSAHTLGTARRIHGNIATTHNGNPFGAHDGGVAVWLIGFHEVDACEVFIGAINALETFPRNVHKAWQTCTATDENGFVLHVKKLVHSERFADHNIGLNLNAHGFETVNFVVYDGLWQAEFWNAIAQHPPCYM